MDSGFIPIDPNYNDAQRLAAYVFDPALGSAITFATSYGSHAEQARQEGAGYGQQQAFGLGSAALDTGTNAITVPTMLKSALPMKELIGQLAKGEFREQGVRAVLVAAGKPMTATAIASQAAPMQAVASNIGGSILKRVIYHSTDPIIDPQSIGNDYKVALGMSLLFSVLGLAGGSHSRQYAEVQIKAGQPIDADTLMGHLADDAKTMPSAANLQKDIQTGTNELYDYVTQTVDSVEQGAAGAGKETGAEAGNLLDKEPLEGYTEGAGDVVNSNEITSIYRAVGPQEYYNVLDSGKFSKIPQALQAKQFGVDLQDAINFAERYSDIAAVLEVKIPKTILDKVGDFTHVDTRIFKNGTISIQPYNLDEFNKYIKEILHIY